MRTVSRVIVLVFYLVMATALATNALDCRRFVFAPICRGISAKRSEMSSLGYSRSPTASTSHEVDELIQSGVDAKSYDDDEGWDTEMNDLLTQKLDETMPNIKLPDIKQQRHLVNKRKLYVLLDKLGRIYADYNPVRQILADGIKRI
ncbi:uncharacterized protein LOC111089837 [Limulus polyphemus]|uniref:Uncharacterized protein LOC111089837 n=1 Tax=Limulus polyphemus TaxID=6850 RepID=A0ABM1TS48_LIMPO|nr:uncharacterized protein LOC111089837 [Limulus polyphemus]